MTSKLCPICRELIWTGREHVCATAWSALVSLDRKDLDNDDYDDEYTVYAYTARVAAEKAAREFDERGDHYIASGETAYVKLCKRDEESPSQYFTVYAEIEVTYNAAESDEEEE